MRSSFLILLLSVLTLTPACSQKKPVAGDKPAASATPAAAKAYPKPA
jgi:hypothetical protein